MAILTATGADVTALNGAIVRKETATEALTVGHAVYIDGATGNIPSLSKAIATAVATSNMYGIVVAGAPEKNGSTTVAIGDICDVVVFGPVSGIAGTAGAFIWVSDTAGSLGDAVGTKSTIAGFMESATVFFVRVAQSVRSA